MMEKLRKMNRI